MACSAASLVGMTHRRLPQRGTPDDNEIECACIKPAREPRLVWRARPWWSQRVRGSPVRKARTRFKSRRGNWPREAPRLFARDREVEPASSWQVKRRGVRLRQEFTRVSWPDVRYGAARYVVA